MVWQMISPLMLAVLPQGGVAAEYVAMVEINHCYNKETGERRFIQVIYWDHCYGPFLHVRSWHMADKGTYHHTPGRKLFPHAILRRCNGQMQVVRCRRFKITHTYNDPEEDDRSRLSVEKRTPIRE